MSTEAFQRRHARRPRVGGLYTILDTASEDKKHLVGKTVRITAAAPSDGHWHCFACSIDGMLGSFDLYDGAKLKRAILKCNCRAYTFPHKPGPGCSTLGPREES